MVPSTVLLQEGEQVRLCLWLCHAVGYYAPHRVQSNAHLCMLSGLSSSLESTFTLLLSCSTDRGEALSATLLRVRACSYNLCWHCPCCMPFKRSDSCPGICGAVFFVLRCGWTGPCLQDLAPQMVHLCFQGLDALRPGLQDLHLPLQVCMEQLQVPQLVALIPAAWSCHISRTAFHF